MPDTIPELKEIKALLRQEPHGLSILEISRKLKIGRNVTTKYLSMLHAAGQVEERRVAAAKLYTLAHRMPVSALLGMTSDLIVVLDRNLHIVLANEAFKEFFRTGDAKIIDQSIETLIAEHTIPKEVRDMTLTALRGEEGRCEVPWKVNGETVHFRAIFIPVALEDGTPGVTIILEDITGEVEAAHEREMALKEKDAQIQSIHYRMRSTLQMISGIMHLQTAHLTDPAVRRAIRALEQQILSLTLAHEDLYLSQNTDQVRMEEYLARLTGTLIDRYGVPPEKIAWTVHAPGIEMPLDVAQFVGFILTELIINVIQHAFPGEMTGEMEVTIERDETGTYSACIRDTGVGIPEGLEIDAALVPGLPIVRLLVEQYLGGRVAARRDGGTTMVITFEGEELSSPSPPCAPSG